MLKFSELGLSEGSLKVINELGFETPTDIQINAIPHLLESENDFVGQAQTGTGKTAAFVFPLIERIDTTSNKIQVLILAPTRELANQVCTEFDKLGKYSKVKTQAVFGGTSYEPQINGIKRNRPHVIVGTPGRVMDLMRKGILNFKKSEYLILDEADEMLNMGFFEDIQEVIKAFNEDRQLWMFSATIPGPIATLIKKNFKKPHFIRVKAQDISNDNIIQQYYVVKRRFRNEALSRLIESSPDMYGIVFCRTRMDTKELADELLLQGYNIESLHGDMGQRERDMAMKNFKRKNKGLMICTDVASRGIDVNNLTHVINYGLPQDNESYVHRIGRTGRAGLEGIAITFVDPKEIGKFRRIEQFAGKKIELKKLPTVGEMKTGLIMKELTKMEGVITAVTDRGSKFDIDNSFDLFQNSFDDLSKEEILKVMFTWKFNKHLRKIDDAGDLNHSRSSSSSREKTTNRKNGRIVAENGNIRLFMNMGKMDGVRLGSLLEDISKQTGIKKKQIQNVEIKTKFGFFEVPEKFGKQFLKSNLKVNNKKVRFEETKS